ncbi:hypothetical protein SUGI_0133150 [Cryptomeria japonica]|uniref:uncharacterized protein LOC131046581 n=1 Tax=Cryptomeria japonica TaxID=3369 RepID=UPI002408CC32|nr:uncharacterized protein LOC131046581 [Cryptomeria japonica]GLJ10689.1 hypothetical protein SUGI_0133150 [Cryptomeria japonica]
MRNRSKQRSGGDKGDSDRFKEEPHLSGAYIRSLVKQLTSHRNHTSEDGGVTCRAEKGTILRSQKTNQEATPLVLNDKEVSSKNISFETHLEGGLQGFNSPNVHEEKDTNCKGAKKAPSSSCEDGKAKKQVRRRLHSNRPYQEHLLDMAEARREIVAALKYHRASMGTANSKQSTISPSKPANIKYRRNTKAHQANNRCHACILKSDICKPNEAVAMTVCKHLFCWACLGEWLNFCSSAATNYCPGCSKPLRSSDVMPLNSLSQCNKEVQGLPLPQGNSISFTHESSNNQSSASLGLSIPETYKNSIAKHSNPLDPFPPWSDTMILTSQIQQNPSLNLDPLISMSQNSWQTTVSSNYCSYPPIQSSMDFNTDHEHMKTWHVAMDDEKMAQIRSIGDQYEMEWNDTINVVNSTWWSNFESIPDYQMKPSDEEKFDVLSALTLPSESLWQDDHFIYSHDWQQQHQYEFGDNTSTVSEPSINSESLTKQPKMVEIEETLDDTAMQRCSCNMETHISYCSCNCNVKDKNNSCSCNCKTMENRICYCLCSCNT